MADYLAGYIVGVLNGLACFLMNLGIEGLLRHFSNLEFSGALLDRIEVLCMGFNFFCMLTLPLLFTVPVRGKNLFTVALQDLIFSLLGSDPNITFAILGDNWMMVYGNVLVGESIAVALASVSLAVKCCTEVKPGSMVYELVVDSQALCLAVVLLPVYPAAVPVMLLCHLLILILTRHSFASCLHTIICP